MKKVMFAAAVLAFTGITALNAEVYTYEPTGVSLQDTTIKDTSTTKTSVETETTKTDTTTTDTTTSDTTTTPKQ